MLSSLGKKKLPYNIFRYFFLFIHDTAEAYEKMCTVDIHPKIHLFNCSDFFFKKMESCEKILDYQFILEKERMFSYHNLELKFSQQALQKVWKSRFINNDLMTKLDFYRKNSKVKLLARDANISSK